MDVVAEFCNRVYEILRTRPVVVRGSGPFAFRAFLGWCSRSASVGRVLHAGQITGRVLPEPVQQRRKRNSKELSDLEQRVQMNGPTTFVSAPLGVVQSVLDHHIAEGQATLLPQLLDAAAKRLQELFVFAIDLVGHKTRFGQVCAYGAAPLKERGAKAAEPRSAPRKRKC